MFEEFWEMMEPIDFGIEKELNETELIQETIKASVFDWIEKYHPREWESNLQVANPENKEELQRWKNWVLWRINHQIIWSWFWDIEDSELEKIITISLHEYFIDDPWYLLYLLDILPSCNN